MKKSPPEAATAETRRLAAIMFTDIVGFSRQMGSNEAHTLRLLAVHNQVIQQAVAAHHGHVIKTSPLRASQGVASDSANAAVEAS